MPSRNLLHKNDIPMFLAWLDSKNIAHRPGRGIWEICQVQRTGGWFPLFSRARMPEHVTVPDRLVQLAYAYLRHKRSQHALPQDPQATSHSTREPQAGLPSPCGSGGPSGEAPTDQGSAGGQVSPPWL